MTTYETWALTLQVAALVPAYVGAGLIYYGIRVMDRNATMRAADSERKHQESMTALKGIIAEQEEGRASMRELIAGQEESRASMREFIAELREGRASMRELIAGQEESRAALRELIVRTSGAK